MSKKDQSPMFEINTDRVSKSYNSRIRQIVLHHTAENFERSFEILIGDTTIQASSHYLINDEPTKKHPDVIYNLVPDNLRAWHAGSSEWRREINLNNTSIGIEIVNLNGNIHQYSEKQIEAVIFLVKELIEKYHVSPVNIVAHSDISPGRKIDPGSLFPWKQLFDNGIGAWYDEGDRTIYREKIAKLPSVATIKNNLHQYGYNISQNNPEIDEEYTNVVKAFQMHFSPNKVDGIMSLEDYIILRSLLKKYYSID